MMSVQGCANKPAMLKEVRWDTARRRVADTIKPACLVIPRLVLSCA